MKNTMRNKDESVLVIVLSETRAYERTFELFKKNLLRRMNADLCLCVAKNSREVLDNPFYRQATYTWTYEEPDDWGEAFDDMQGVKGVNTNWRKLLGIKDQWLGGVKGEEAHPGSAGILLFFRLFLKESLIEHKLLDRYDRFIITRSDFVHRVPHVPLALLNPKYIWIPDEEDYGGYTDRHIVVHRDDVLKVLSISDRIILDPDRLYKDMSCSSKWNLEKYIKFSFAQLGLLPRIKRFPYTMYSIRLANGHTRWSKGYWDKTLGYYIKYRSEYQSYEIAAALIKDDKDWNHLKIVLFFIVKYSKNKLKRALVKAYLKKRIKKLLSVCFP